MMDKIKTIIKKEWAEVFKNRWVLFSITFMPLMLTALPLIMLYATRQANANDLTTEMPGEFARFCAQGLSDGECFQVYLVNQFLILFMMLPLIIPVNIAAYSIVGEKTNRSLEPLLATPITTTQLLVGKNLAAAIPAILVTWAGFIVYAVGARILISNPVVVRALLDPMWWIAVLFVGPLLALLSVNFAMMVSSRVNDPRVAEQLSAVVIIPLLALFFSQLAGLLILDTGVVLVMAVILIGLDGVMFYIASDIFERENILTKWH